jgi:hypothetical protein
MGREVFTKERVIPKITQNGLGAIATSAEVRTESAQGNGAATNLESWNLLRKKAHNAQNPRADLPPLVHFLRARSALKTSRDAGAQFCVQP